MPASRAGLEAFDVFLSGEVEAARGTIERYAPGLNPASPPQLAKFLFEDLGLTKMKTTGSGKPSTDREVLDLLQHHHPVVPAIIRHRTCSKLQGTYAQGMKFHLTPAGRVHATYNIGGARSGRLSSSDPNMQNIPRAHTPEGKMAKDVFRAMLAEAYGWGGETVLLEADYNQLELRVAADLSGDPEMISIYRAGEDFHLATAKFIGPTVWGVHPDRIEDKHRTGAKTFNFGIIYGMSDAGIAARARCSMTEAAAIRQAVLGKFKLLDRFTRDRLREAKQTGVCWTWWDGQRARRRSLYQVADHDGERRSVAEHSSWNTPVQGTASDYCLASVIALVDWIVRERPPCRLVATVHDSILFEVRADFVRELAERCGAVMTSWPTRSGVPLVADFKVGEAWGSMEKWELPEVRAAGLLGGPQAALEASLGLAGAP